MEQQLDKTDGLLTNLERMTHDIEYAQIEVQVVEGLKVGNESLKKLHQMLSIEDIERIMDETQDGIEKQKEIDELLSGQLTAEDDEAVLAELEALTAEEEAKATLGLPSVPSEDVGLPNVPEDVAPRKIPVSSCPSALHLDPLR